MTLKTYDVDYVNEKCLTWNKFHKHLADLQQLFNFTCLFKNIYMKAYLS